MDLRDCLFDRRVKFLCFGDKQPSLANYRDAFGATQCRTLWIGHVCIVYLIRSAAWAWAFD